MTEKKHFAHTVGMLGGAAVTFYSGYLMTQFEKHPKVPLDNMLYPIVKVSGYALMGYSVYNLFRSWIIARSE